MPDPHRSPTGAPTAGTEESGGPVEALRGAPACVCMAAWQETAEAEWHQTLFLHREALTQPLLGPPWARQCWRKSAGHHQTPPQAAEGSHTGPAPRGTPHTQLTGPPEKGRGTLSRQGRCRDPEAGFPRLRPLRVPLGERSPAISPNAGNLAVSCVWEGLHPTFPPTVRWSKRKKVKANHLKSLPLLHRPQGLGSCSPGLSPQRTAFLSPCLLTCHGPQGAPWAESLAPQLGKLRISRL